MRDIEDNSLEPEYEGNTSILENERWLVSGDAEAIKKLLQYAEDLGVDIEFL